MMHAYHINCVQIESLFGPAIGHCVLIESHQGLTLIDAGLGMAETKAPEKRLGKELVEITGFRFDENLTAIRQIEQLGLDPKTVNHIVCSHLDPDHIGGLADFPKAKVHVSREEYISFQNGHERYLPQQLYHRPKIELYEKNDSEWFGLSARQVNLDFEIYLIPLFGHTLGHCGIAYRTKGQWTFYVGDAYYLRDELQDKNHPIDQLATLRAMDNFMRKESLEKVRRVIGNNDHNMAYFGYHDPMEFQ